MPTIPMYEQQTRASGAGLGPGPTDAGRGLAAVGQALEGVQNDQFRLRALEQQKREEQSVVAANDTLMQARSSWMNQLEQRKQSAEPGAPNFTPQILSDFDKDASARLETAQTPKARNYLKERLDQVRLGLQEEALKFEAGAVVKQKVDTLTQSADQARTAADFRPQDFDHIVLDQKTAIANSGLPREQQIELVQKHTYAIADAAVTGMIRRDPYAALKELNNEQSQIPAMRSLDYHDRERLRKEAETEIRQRKAEAREAQTAAREALNDRVADSETAYLAGIPVNNPPSRSEFLAAYPADRRDEAERRYAAFTNIQQVGADLQAATRMTLEEQNQLLEERRPKQVEGAADAMRAYKVLAQHVAGLQKELDKDPAEYVEAYNPTVKSASNALSANPSADAAQAYAQASVSAQRALGVIQPRLLTEAQAHAMSQRLKLSGNGEDVVQSIAQERAAWGRYWPQALSEAAPKLNPAVQVIALGMDPVPAQRLASVASLKPEELAKVLPPNVREADVKAAVQGKLQDFGETLVGLAGAEDQLARLNDAAVKLTSSYVAGGEKLDKAAQRAASEVVLSRYDIQTWRGNALRIPKGVDSGLVISGLASTSSQVLGDLKVSSSDVRWRTLPDDSGIVLEDAATNRPLAHKDGSLVTFTFDQLQQAAVNRTEDVRRLNQELGPQP